MAKEFMQRASIHHACFIQHDYVQVGQGKWFSGVIALQAHEQRMDGLRVNTGAFLQLGRSCP